MLNEQTLRNMQSEVRVYSDEMSIEGCVVDFYGQHRPADHAVRVTFRQVTDERR